MLWKLLAVAAAWRVLVSLLTAVPSRDGANYLWMAERLAEGEARLALTEVFPPGLPLLLAPFVRLGASVGFEAFEAAKAVQVLVGVATVWVVVRLTQEHLGRGSGFAVACMMLFAPRPAQLGAEVGAEPLLALLVGLGAWDAARGRTLLAGLWSGLAFWVKPEGLVLAVAVALTRRNGWRALLPAGAAFFLLGAWRAWLGLAFWPERKWELHEEWLFGDGASLAERAAHYGANLLELPVRWFEAFGVLGLLALIAVAVGRDDAERAPRATLYAALLGVCAAIVSFLARWRFLVGWIPAVAMLATAGLRRLPRNAHWPVLFLVMLSSILLGLRTLASQANRFAERRLAEWLAEDTTTEQRIVTDLTRVLYFAGRRPLEPRPFGPEELIAQCRAPDARYLVLTGDLPVGRTGGRLNDRPTPTLDEDAQQVVDALGEGWARVQLPEDLARYTRYRGLMVWRNGPR